MERKGSSSPPSSFTSLPSLQLLLLVEEDESNKLLSNFVDPFIEEESCNCTDVRE